MANELATAYITLIPSLRGAAASITKQLGGVDTSGAGKTMGGKAGNGFASGLLGTGTIAGAAAAVTSEAMGVISSSMDGAISRVDTMNNFPKVMQNLGYSSEDASKSIKTMSDRLDGLPTSLNSMTSMVQQIAPLTGGLDEATNIGLAFNDMLLASGKGTADQSRAMEQYTQMLSKGTADLQSWRTLQEVMPGQLNQVAQALLGPTANSQALYDAMKNGTISMDDFNNAMLNLDQNGANGFASFSQQAKDATQGIGTALENVKNRVSKAIGEIVQSIGASNISGAINNFSSSFSGIADGISTVIGGIKQGLADSGAAQSIQDIGTAMQKLAPSADTLKEIGDAIGTVIGYFMTVGKTIAESGLGETVSAAFGKIKDALAPVVQEIGPILLQWLQAVLNFLNFIIPPIASLVSAILPVLVKIVGVLFEVSAVWIKVIVDVFSGAVALIQGVWGGIVGFFQGIWNGICAVFSAVGEWFDGVFASAAAGIQPAWAAVTGFFSGIWNGICAVFSAVGEWFGGVFGSAASAIQGIWSGITGFFQGIWDALSNAAGGAVNNVTGFISGLPGTIMGFFSDAGQWLWDAGSNIMSGLLSGIKSAFETVKNFVSGIGTWIAEHKGPKAYDLALLIPNGQWIMQSLASGLEKGMPEIRGLLNDFSEEIARTPFEIMDITPQESLMRGGISTIANLQMQNAENANKDIHVTAEVTSVLDGRQVGYGTAKYVQEKNNFETTRRNRIGGVVSV